MRAKTKRKRLRTVRHKVRHNRRNTLLLLSLYPVKTDFMRTNPITVASRSIALGRKSAEKFLKVPAEVGLVSLPDAAQRVPDAPIFFGIFVTHRQSSIFDSFLIEFMSFFDKKHNRDLRRTYVDFFLTFVKQQIIK
ncbi:MAG: hypothetical protein D3914_09180 [Candidatus Electrothrix sp. LOE2]|nr:hypothetical protein [Candidatus Electrothrix sp. LOE2]